jgi:ABC-type glycerol-3-phosphate transport system permease component
LIIFQLGFIDKISAIVVLYTAFNLSFTVWMMKGFFDDLPVEVEESALIDGCTPLNTLWLISLPLSRPALATTLIFSFIFSWNEFLLAFILTRANAKTAPLAILEGVGWIGIRWEYMSAAAVIAMIPPIVLAIIARRQLVSGLTLGAVK